MGTTKDMYAAAVIQGLLARGCDWRSAVNTAAEAAVELAEVACDNWGHDWKFPEHGYSERTCRRCDKKQTRESDVSRCGSYVDYGEWEDEEVRLERERMARQDDLK
jgi:hypothetical protein